MNPILPGSTIGVLGSGQLGRMFALAARRMGYRVHTLSPETDTPTGQISDLERTASYDDVPAIRDFARRVDVITFEFENIPLSAVKVAEEIVPVRPSGFVLHTAQHRLREKIFLSKNGFPVAPFVPIKTLDDLKSAVEQLGTPSVLKTAGFGYDGKGQKIIRSSRGLETVYRELNGAEMVLEGFVDFEKELSVIVARGLDKKSVHYDVFENHHENHILDLTFAPAAIDPRVAKKAVEIARAIANTLDVVGVLCVEMFLTKKGNLVVNELAPRPHNSGHLTVDACVTSQFEQQLRAVCGLPLGSTELVRPAAMANLLGDIWKKGTPRWENALKDPAIKLHLYGKSTARPGRKMGHITALGTRLDDAQKKARAARAALIKSR